MLLRTTLWLSPARKVLCRSLADWLKDRLPACCVATGLLHFTSSESTSPRKGVAPVLLAPLSSFKDSGSSLTWTQSSWVSATSWRPTHKATPHAAEAECCIRLPLHLTWLHCHAPSEILIQNPLCRHMNDQQTWPSQASTLSFNSCCTSSRCRRLTGRVTGQTHEWMPKWRCMSQVSIVILYFYCWYIIYICTRPLVYIYVFYLSVAFCQFVYLFIQLLI